MICLFQWFASLSVHQSHLENLFDHIAGSHPQSFGPVGLEQEWRMCMSNKFSGNAHAAGLGPIH